MHVFYVLDVDKCTEESDLGSAILYCYPSEVSKEELYTFCSQIIGVVQFLQATFSAPLVLNLGTKSFSFKRIQNYLLVLGSHNTSNHLLKKQLGLLISIFTFYYGDFNKFLELCGHDWSLFHSRLHTAWDYCIQMTKSSFIHGPAIKQVSSEIHLKSCHLLSIYEECSNIIGSALISGQVLLLTDVLQHYAIYLVLLCECKKLFESDVLIPYALPADVVLKRVYLNSEEKENVLDNSILQVGLNSHCRKFMLDSIDQNSWMSHRWSLITWPSSEEKGFNLRPSHVLCQYHSSLISSLASRNRCKKCFAARKSSSDFEFQCFLCEIGSSFHSHKRCPPSLAGSLDVSFVKRNEEDLDLFSYSKLSGAKPKSRKHHTWFCTDFIRKYSDHVLYHENIKLPKQLFNPCIDCFEHSLDWGKDAILYIHKLRNSFTFLLMDNCPTEDELHFMWCCSFSALLSLEFQASQQAEKPQNQLRGNILTVYHTGSGVFFGNQMVSSEQSMVHTDFLTHESFHSIYLGRYSQSFYACNNKTYQLFYEQMEASNQKPSWIVQMYKKAHHKAKKYLNI